MTRTGCSEKRPKHFFSSALKNVNIIGVTNERNSHFAQGVIFAHQFPPQLFVGIVRKKEGRKEARRPWDAAGGGTVPKHMAQDKVADMGLWEWKIVIQCSVGWILRH